MSPVSGCHRSLPPEHSKGRASCKEAINPHLEGSFRGGESRSDRRTVSADKADTSIAFVLRIALKTWPSIHDFALLCRALLLAQALCGRDR
jgi:hypothetical protein